MLELVQVMKMKRRQEWLTAGLGLACAYTAGQWVPEDKHGWVFGTFLCVIAISSVLETIGNEEKLERLRVQIDSLKAEIDLIRRGN